VLSRALHRSALLIPPSDSPTKQISPFGNLSIPGADNTRAEPGSGDGELIMRGFESGDTIDHFVLMRPLGEGGFGQVWLARDSRLGREVAIKLPHRILLPDSLHARRFRREAEIAAKLTHPNLVPILDAVLEQDRAYIVSEYCPGPTLMQWLRDRNGPVPPRMAVSIVAQLASGLAAAHDRGLIHRDIKPSNIILADAETDHPVPRLTDFGMARMVHDSGETQDGTLIGSGQYMSPEQATGNIDEHGPHSDVHALGVLLYEILTGESPFAAASDLDTIRRIVSLDPPSVRQLRPSLSRDISAVCQRCLEKQPDRRYGNAGELHSDLNRLLDGRPPLARPVGRIGRVWRWSGRNRLVASLALMAMIGLLVGVVELAALAIQARRHADRSEAQSVALREALVVAEVQRNEAESQSAEAEQQRLNAEQQRVRAVHQESIAQSNRQEWRRTSYLSDVSLAFLRFNQGLYGEVRKLLDRQIPATGDSDLRTIEWWLLDNEVRSRYQIWGYHDGPGTDVVRLQNSPFEQVKQTIVTGGVDGRLLFWDAESGREVHRLDGFKKRLIGLAAMPDGGLAIAGPDWPLFGRNVIAIDPVSGRTRDVFHSHPTTLEVIRVNRDASVIASACRYKNIKCWSIKDQKSFTIPTNQRHISFSLSANGERLMTSRRDPDAIQVWNPLVGEMIEDLPLKHAANVTGANEHEFAAYTQTYRDGFGLIDSSDLQNRAWIPTPSEPNAMKFSDNDRYLAVADQRSGIDLFEMTKAAGDRLPKYRPITRVAGLGGRTEDIVFLGDGEFATVALDGAVERFAPLKAGHQRQVIGADSLEFIVPIQSPEGVLTLGFDGVLRHFHAEDSGQSATPDRSVEPTVVWRASAKLNSCAISADETTIAITDDEENLHLLTRWRDASGRIGTPEVRTIAMPHSPVTRKLGLAAFSDCGRYVVATGNTNQVLAYDLQRDSSEPYLRRWFKNLPLCLVFSPTTNRLVMGGLSGIEVVDVASGATVLRRKDWDSITTACFSPDEHALVIGTRSGAIQWLDSKTGDPLFTFHGVDALGSYSSQITALRFVSSTRFVSIGNQGILHLWDTEQHVQLGSFDICSQAPRRRTCRSLTVFPTAQKMVFGFDHLTQGSVYRWSWKRSQ